MNEAHFTVIKTRRQDGAFVEKFELAMLAGKASLKHAREHVFMLNSSDNEFWYELVDSDSRIQRKFEFTPQYSPEKKRNPILMVNWSFKHNG